jgi:hypothetical protein
MVAEFVLLHNLFAFSKDVVALPKQVVDVTLALPRCHSRQWVGDLVQSAKPQVQKHQMS